MKLWHCASARSLRPLWTLEEMGLEYELEVLPFPPRDPALAERARAAVHAHGL